MGCSWKLSNLLLAVCILLCGCNGINTPKEIQPTPEDEKKARLLKQIDRRFEDPELHFELGKLYQGDGMWAQAEQEYKTALNFNPVYRQAQAARVKVLLDSGDKATAEQLAEIYIDQASISDSGSLLLALGFQDEGLDEYALRCYRRALDLNPNSAKINRQIGYYYLSKGDKQRALDYLSRSFQLNPNQPDVAGQLGRLGVTVGIPRKASKSSKSTEKIVEEYDKKLTQ